MMTSLELALFLSCLCLCEKALAADVKIISSVRQEEGLKSANVGENVTLRCFYEGNVAAELYWYKQTLGQKPQLISRVYKSVSKGAVIEGFTENPRYTLDTNDLKNHLTILNLVPADSATYYCVSSYVYNFQFGDGTTLSVEGSGLNTQAYIYQPVSETIQPGGSMTCTVQSGASDGEHSLYWFRNSKESQPGLIYTQGGRNDPSDRLSNTNSCVLQLPKETMTVSQTATYNCAIPTCGNALFGNRTKWDSAAEDESPRDSLVYFLGGALAFTTVLLVCLTISVYNLNTRSCQCLESQRVSAATTTGLEVNQGGDNLHYAALRVQKASRSRSQRDDTRTECVYSGVKQQF